MPFRTRRLWKSGYGGPGLHASQNGIDDKYGPDAAGGSDKVHREGHRASACFSRRMQNGGDSTIEVADALIIGCTVYCELRSSRRTRLLHGKALQSNRY
jgi:hypothetical protein